jgi:hypothetical protein
MRPNEFYRIIFVPRPSFGSFFQSSKSFQVETGPRHALLTCAVMASPLLIDDLEDFLHEDERLDADLLPVIDLSSVKKHIPSDLVANSLRVSIHSRLPTTSYPLSPGKISTLVAIASQWAVDVIPAADMLFIESPYGSELRALLCMMDLAEADDSYRLHAMAAFKENAPSSFAIVHDFIASWVIHVPLVFY